jgi:hypothetical protein
VGRDGFIVLPYGKTSIEWAKLEVVMIDDDFQALVVPTNLSDSEIAETKSDYENQTKDSPGRKPLRVFKMNQSGYIFMPGPKDYLAQQDAKRAAIRGLNRPSSVPTPPQDLITQLPPPKFQVVKQDTGYVWITAGLHAPANAAVITNGVTGYPRLVKSDDPKAAANGRDGGSLLPVPDNGLILRKRGIVSPNYELAQTLVLDGSFTALIVPDDVTDEDIQKTISEAYTANNTDKTKTPIRWFRLQRNGMIVLPSVAGPAK